VGQGFESSLRTNLQTIVATILGPEGATRPIRTPDRQKAGSTTSPQAKLSARRAPPQGRGAQRRVILFAAPEKYQLNQIGILICADAL